MKIVLSAFFLLLVISLSLTAQSQAPLDRAAMPLEKLLNPDGTLNTNTGFNGSLDAQGWNMDVDEKGNPRFLRQNQSTASDPADANWDSIFAPRGLNGVQAIAISGGSLFVGGYFIQAGGISANRIVKWDGTSWTALGTGMNGVVKTIAVRDTEVYAGGQFTTAGGVSANYIAKWDGTVWTALGTGMNALVASIAIIGTDIYAGGNFTTAGGASANYIAKWDGSNWINLGTGLNNPVFALTSDGSNIYVGGGFTTAGGTSANYIAKWDGVAWSGLGSGMNSVVRALASSGSDIYAGGDFTTADGASALSIAKWNGVSWSTLGTGTFSSINTLWADGSTLYAGGAFFTIGGVGARYLAKWDGSSWSALGSQIGDIGTQSPVFAIAGIGSSVYVGGNFYTVGELAVTGIAVWNGTSWASLGTGFGLDAYVNAVAVSGSNVYALGNFRLGGDVIQTRIGKWNGTNWSPLGLGITDLVDEVNTLTTEANNVYAGGYFTSVSGTTSIQRLAKWNGTTWAGVGGGVGSPFSGAYAIASSGSDLYVGGNFFSAGCCILASNIAKWNGSSWAALGSGTNGYVSAIAVSGSSIYVGGGFTTAGGVTVNTIAKWDGTSWSSLGAGTNGIVYAVAVSGNDVYIGGNFTTAGGVTANNIAKWDGSNWSGLGTGVDGGVSAIAVSGNNVYIGGTFTMAGGLGANNIARWNGTNWSALGSGVNNSVSSLGVVSNDIYVGGYFTSAGNKSSSYIAKWHQPVHTITISNGPHGSSSPSGVVSIAEGNNQTVNFSSGIGYHIDSVIVDGSYIGSPSSYTFTNVTVDHTIRSVFVANPTITATVGLHGVISPSGTVSVSYNQNQSFTITPSVGFHIDSVIVDGAKVDSTTSFTFLNVIANHTIRVTFAINVYTITATAGLHGSISLSGITMINYDGGQLYTMTPDSGYLVANVLVDSVAVGSMASYNFSHVQRNHTISVSFTDIQTLAMNVANRWNLISVPLFVTNFSKDSLFPASVSKAFAYNGSYIISSTLANGAGYWLKFNTVGSVIMSGLPLTRDSIDVIQGWNLIGSISSPVAVSSISSLPGGIVTSQYFTYTGTYVPRDTIEPGMGYWVKVNQAGKLILSSSPAMVPSSNLIQIQRGSELPPMPPEGNLSESPVQLPKEFGLGQNYPNPFNPGTIISYQLPVKSLVSLKVYNVLGQEVATLVDQVQDAGNKSVAWNAAIMPSGLYYYRLHAGEFTGTKKLMLLK